MIKKKLNESCDKIGKSTYNFMKSKITKNLKLLEKEDGFSLNVATALIVQSIGNVDVAILLTAKELYDSYQGNSEAFTQLLTIYFECLLNNLGKDGEIIRSNLAKNINH